MTRIELDHRSALVRDGDAWRSEVVYIADRFGPGQHAMSISPVSHEMAMIRLKSAYMRAYTDSSRLLCDGFLGSERQKKAAERVERLRAALKDLGEDVL